MKIGILKKVELREIWSREDTDFTNWLNDNLDILGETIDLDLEEPEKESYSLLRKNGLVFMHENIVIAP